MLSASVISEISCKCISKLADKTLLFHPFPAQNSFFIGFADGSGVVVMLSQ